MRKTTIEKQVVGMISIIMFAVITFVPLIVGAATLTVPGDYNTIQGSITGLLMDNVANS